MASRAALAVVLAALIAWPALAAIRKAVRPTQEIAARGPIDPVFTTDVARPLGLAWATLRVTALAAALAVPVGAVLALLLTRTDMWGRGPLGVLVLIVLFVPMPLHAVCWLNALGNAGRMQAIGSRPLLVGWVGAAIIHALAALPWVVVLVGIGVRAVERELEESALLDMSAWRVSWVVTLRRSLGAIAAAALAVAVLTAGDMTVTDMLQVRTYAEEAFVQAQLGKGPAAAAKVAVPPLLVLGTLIALGGRALSRLDPVRLTSRRRKPHIWPLGRWRAPVGVIVWLVVGSIMALPIAGLAWRAGRVGGAAALGRPPSWSIAGLVGTLQRAWPDVVEMSALSRHPLSSPLLASSIASVLAATLAVALAWGLCWTARGSSAWRAIALGVTAILLATPAPIVGLALKLGYLHVSLVHDTLAIVVLALAARALPYAIVVLWPAVRAIPREYLEVAALEGQGRFGLGWRVGLPLARRAILAAWGVAFVLALGELPASNLVLPPSVMTISMRVWMLLHNGVESHLAGVGLVLLGIYGLAGALAGRLMERTFN